MRLGNWYADPQINIFLRGKGRFKVTGGIQRFSGQRTIVATLDCGEKLKVTHYKVKRGHALKVYQDGKLVIRQVPPRLRVWSSTDATRGTPGRRITRGAA